jgi:hypothetical protein
VKGLREEKKREGTTEPMKMANPREERAEGERAPTASTSSPCYAVINLYFENGEHEI